MKALLPQIPQIDEALCAEAVRLATGAKIHDAMADVGVYRASVMGADRLAKMLADGVCAGRDVEEDLAGRVATAATYETKLRAFVAKMRQAAAGL